ncbi:S41 family peptidase [Flavobacterium defluvii]|uniref:Tricorn protease C1 domain-containing protein n=1 Tax=Flavobacterium defluvii TaxID=370979 RepID=A0A1M5N4G8_9FLAO|nr:S41 family peptidase [Flavobacterium defluvii]SHG84332.1 Tricorn protease C1 domain-containing protein [Flavobacterium defluvii]
MKSNSVILTFLLLFCFSANSQTEKKLSKPEKDFETFWATFKDNYAFFGLKKVNWDESYKKFRPLITKKTKEKELLETFEEMVAPLKDGHITISKDDKVIYKVKKQSPFLDEFKGIENQLWETSFLTLENNGFSKIKASGPLFKGIPLYNSARNAAIGYIRISRCFGNVESLFDDKKEKEDIDLMLTLFDSILESFSDTKAIIIDMRSNGGGHGGDLLAARFASEKRITHYKSIRQKGDYENFTTPEPIYITPNNGVQYLKPIVILTNDRTASSAEDFTISLYQQPNVTTIGTNTSGMMSDMFGGDLSNKISFTLSNQRYYSTDNKLLEDAGVPVKIEVKNTKQDIEKKIDPVILKAIEVLK